MTSVPLAAELDRTRSTKEPEAKWRRLALLSDRMGEVTRPDRSAVPRDRWLLLVGGAAMPMGLLLIVLGWYGSAQTVLPFEQTPFLISGGLLGSALVTGGGFLYFAYWLTLGVREAREERGATAAHQERLEGLLLLVAQRLGAPAGGSRSVVTVGGSMLHREDCVVTVGQAVSDAPWDADLARCGICRPEQPAPPSTRRKAR